MVDPVFLSIRARGLIALPADLRRRYGLDLPGAQLELRERSDGVLELRPHISVPADQAWFWSKEWQAMERAVDEHVARGEVTHYPDDETFLHSLDLRLNDADQAAE